MHKRITPLLGYLIIPFLFILPYIRHSLITENYTLIINAEPVYILPLLACLCYLFYILMKAGEILHIPGYKKIYPLPVILFLCIMCIPYREESAPVSQIHVLLGYIVFILMNLIMFRMFVFAPKYRLAYVLCTMLAMGIAVTFLSVCGLAEAIYASSLVIILTAKVQQKK